MEELNVEHILISKQGENSENYGIFKKIINNKKIKVIVVGKGDKIQIENDFYFDILWPNNEKLINDNVLNNNSIVCKLCYNNFSILFTGDIEEIAEKEILQDKIDFVDESGKDLKIVIEKLKYKQCDMKALYDTLYKKLTCTLSYNMAFFDLDHIYVPLGFDKVVKANLGYVIKTHKNRINNQLNDLRRKLKILEIIQELKNKNLVKQIFDFSHEEAINWIRNKFKVDENISTAVLQKPISYLTKEHLEEIQKLKDDIKILENDDSDIYEYLFKKYSDMKKKVLKEVGKNGVKFIKLGK